MTEQHARENDATSSMPDVEMITRRITLPDGRYLIFYNFGEEPPEVMETGGVGEIPPEAGGEGNV